jgi:nucleoside-diphosphate-sugar epimerase
MLDSAINGTLNVLRSCKKNPFLKRVVLTSSSSTVRLRDEAEFPPNVQLDETSWSSVEFCESIKVVILGDRNTMLRFYANISFQSCL